MVSTKATWWHLYICLFNSNGHMIPVMVTWFQSRLFWRTGCNHIPVSTLISCSSWKDLVNQNENVDRRIINIVLLQTDSNPLSWISRENLQNGSCKNYWLIAKFHKDSGFVESSSSFARSKKHHDSCKCRAHLRTEPWFELRPAGQQALTKGTLAPGPSWIALSPGTSLLCWG